ncbi:uncharacterized protein BDZ99DRAFT_163154 [Mytilinidion resinicola]|uniref:Ring-like domain-containing protein n=1 Tax=Mytilinidion resinicola TaxID=574789 RepID=A0A6A6Y4M9_9PEZI|nr:uncharacterized protein BDZ99DRAFT_163154 [Mytilinidion resinicola]KAF2803801.1 hypothetical protein BDZ99DRAFT_163154 [Mytilinidion resinicola]
MVLEYFTKHTNKHKHAEKGEHTAQTPILNDEDELFLQRITSEGTPPPLPERPVVILDNGTKLQGKDAQTALMDGAEKVPLPTSPPVDSEGKELVDGEQKTTSEEKKRKFLSYLPAIPGRGKGKAKEAAAANLHAIAASSKPGAPSLATAEEQKEQQDLTAILDDLNLSAVNNRVFSFSKESQELLDKFKLVLKDLINGVPTAYDDLEKLLTGSEAQLKKLFGALPPFLQALVKSLPAKMTATLGPEFMVAASEKPGFDAMSASGSKPSRRPKIPSLKSLVASQGAVATMLKSILNFLKLRFPAFVTGTNVLMSLAVFLLLFVFWYCHKRGRETRLERERLDAEGNPVGGESDISDLEDSTVLEKPRDADVQPPLIIHPDSAAPDKPSATVADMPSVLNLPEPAAVPLPAPEGTTPLREEPIEVKR